MRNGLAGPIWAEAEAVSLSEHEADGSSVASDYVAVRRRVAAARLLEKPTAMMFL